MAESRRRTLAASGSGIPVPSSAVRSHGTLRQSLAPSAGGGQSQAGLQPSSSINSSSTATAAARQSMAPPSRSTNSNRMSLAYGSSQDYHPMGSTALPTTQSSSQASSSSQLFSQGHGGPPQPPMTASRNNNFYHSVNNNHPHALGAAAATMSVGRQGVLRSSTVPQQQLPSQPYAPPSERRSSVYRRSTMNAAPMMTTSTPGGLAAATLTSFEKDPRNARSGENKRRWAADIVQFLISRNYAPGADEKMLMAPTGAQWVSIFKFMIQQYDPAISFDVKGKTFNDLVVPILKSIGYPFANSITKSHLQAAGSQQSWPNMLAMLHWIVTTIENAEQAFVSSHELQMPAFDLAKEAGQEVVSHAWLEYINSIYPTFLEHELSEEDKAQDLDLFFSRLEQSRLDQRARVAELEAESDALQKEWDELMASADPVIALEEALQKIENDKVKFVNYTKACADRRDSSKAQLAMAYKAKEEFQKERVQKEAEIEQFKRLIAAQGLTPVEIQHMNSERLSLQKELETINKKSRAVLEKAYGLEIDLQKQLNSASNACSVYESKATALGVIPGPVDGYEHVNFSQEVNGAAENPVPDCTTTVKPALAALRNKTRVEVSRINAEDVMMEEKITRVNEAIAELNEAIESNEAELEQAEQDNADLKETVASEFTAMNAELERLQSQVTHLQHTMGHSLAQAEYRFDQRTLEKMQATEETNELRRVNRDALETALDSLFTYKEHIVEQVSKLNQLADEHLVAF